MRPFCVRHLGSFTLAGALILRIYYDYILLILSTIFHSVQKLPTTNVNILHCSLRSGVAWRTTVVVDTRLGGVVGVAVVVEVNLVDTRLENIDHRG